MLAYFLSTDMAEKSYPGRKKESKSSKPIAMMCLMSFLSHSPKGHISTGGLVQFLSKVEEEDSMIVKVLKRQGAIPFVKTNVPQSMIK